MGLTVHWSHDPTPLGNIQIFTPAYLEHTGGHSYIKHDDGEELTPAVMQKQGDVLQQLVNIIKAENLGLKIIVLMGGHGVEMEETVYANYLEYIADRFSDEPVIMGYDIYNEPVWFTEDNDLSKLEVNAMCLNWYNSIKQVAPFQFVTIGSKLFDLFKWDPEIIPFDFISFHPYALKVAKELWAYQPPIDRYKVHLKYMQNNFSIPYLIGETGYSGTNLFRASCDLYNIHESVSSVQDQVNFADTSTKYCKYYGHKGYTWWKFKDQPWFDCTDYYAFKNYWGFIYMEAVAPGNQKKPLADFFNDYDPSIYCTSCIDPNNTIYYNPTYTNQTDTILVGTIRNPENNNQVVDDVFIWARISKNDNNYGENSFAITDNDGNFTIKTSYDPNSSAYDLKLSLDYSKPGWESIYVEYGRNEIPTTPVQYYISKIDPALIAQKPEYNGWIISSDENITWTEPKFPGSRDVIIETGATLTIKSPVYFRNDPKIVVQRGGKLILDEGSYLSTCNGDLWQGIEVWGDPLHPHTNDTAHGIVELKNGAIIENARVAISTTRKDEDGYLVNGYHGGIIKADEAYFENNKRAVEIWPFDFENKSYFKLCSFITSAELPDNNDFEYFIVLNDIDGVTIEGCSFENNREANGVLIERRGVGIYSIESQYSISAYNYSPEGPYIENYFGKLNYGIRALGITSSKAPSIEDCSFEYNRTGAYLSGLTSASVLSNYYLVESFDTAYDKNIYCGLYLDNSTQYHVEDNFFEHNDSTARNEDHTIGMTVNNSGAETNEIYRNTFKTLDIGILAQNQNRDASREYGLTIKCNDFGDNKPNDPSIHDNTYDIAITKFGGCDYPGIKEHQGSNLTQSSPAGNRFSQASNGIVDSDYSNQETPRIYYWQHDPTNESRINLSYYIPLHVTKRSTDYEWNESDCCPPSFNSGDPGEIKEMISSYESDADSVNMLLTALVDGGNTQELESDVILSTPDQAYDLYTDLNMKSPYLTDTVMVEAVRKENVLNEVMVRDILVANPQSAKSAEVMDELDNRINPLPDYMIAEIEEGNDSLGDKEIMEARKYHYLHKRNISINDLKRHYKTDTTGHTNRDTLIDFLTNTNSLQAKYELAFEYLHRKNYSNTNTVLTNIPSQFALSSEENELYQDYSDYIDILIDLKQNNQQLYGIDSSQIDLLDSLANDIYSYSGAYARNVLLYNEIISYSEPYILPDSTLKTEEYRQTAKNSLKDYPAFKVYPNPAANYVTIEYNLSNESCNGYVEIINSQGRIVLQAVLRAEKNSKFIHLNDEFSSGTYFCKLVCKNHVIATEKLTIIR